MEKLPTSKNSVFFRNVIQPIGDLSEIGILLNEENHIAFKVPRKWHTEYSLYDVVYYNIENHDFELAIARNTRECEAVGVICKLTEDTAWIMNNGSIQYEPSEEELEYEDGVDMYLSDTTPGKLTMEVPERVVKRVARFHKDAIMVDIGTGELVEQDNPELDIFEPYTQEELDDIVSCTWWEERHA